MNPPVDKTHAMADPSDRQYHIGLGPGDVGDFVLLCGDPARAERFAGTHMDSIELKASHREFLTFTGTMKGIRLSAMATGMGPDNTEIAVVECCRIARGPVFIRMGSSGGIQPWIEPGDLVVSSGAMRLENTSAGFAPEGFPAVADPGVTWALEEVCRKMGLPCHVGITVTAPGFYGAQGRNTETFKSLHPERIEDLARAGAINFEMESSVLFTLAAAAGLRAGTVCAVYANRVTGDLLDEAGRSEAEGRCLAVAAETVCRLSTTRKNQ